VQVAHAGVLLVGDLAVRLLAGSRVEGSPDLRDLERDAGELEGARGRQLEGARAGGLEVRDPDGAVDGRAADGAGALRDDVARAPAQRGLAVDAEEVELGAGDRVEDPGMALTGPDLRTTAAVGSEVQSIARTSCVINGRRRPVVRGSAASSGSPEPPATSLPTASTSASVAARRTSWR
jgi:hypothetical protein